MALTFPLPLSVFADLLRPMDGTPFLDEPKKSAGSASGTIYEASNGSAMWTGRVIHTFKPGPETGYMLAMFDVLRQPGRPFLMRDKERIGPQNDKSGAILAGRRLALSAIDTARIKIGPATGEMTIRGFPPELRLLPGDFISWEYGSSPVRYALHRVAPGALSYGHDPANPGRSVWIDVVPALRPGSVVGATVSLVKPACKALAFEISGGSWRPGGLRDPIEFRWRQTLR